MRIVVRVQPNAKRTHVGGRYGDAEAAVLVVRVKAPAVEGKANDAVVAAVADAFDVPKRAVRIVSGQTSRLKTLDVEDIDERAVRALMDAVD